jgi:hypothetical protein
MHDGAGSVSMAFDQNDTLASSDLSDNNVLQTGANLQINFDEITPETAQALDKQEATPTALVTTEPEIMIEEDSNDYRETILIGIIITSVVLAGGLLTFYLKSKHQSE